MDIGYFMKRFGGEYRLVRRRLNQIDAGSKRIKTSIPDFSGIDNEIERYYRKLGMSNDQINAFKRDLQTFACEQIPLHHGGISVDDMLDYVGGSTSEVDNQRIFFHLESCLDCRIFLFEKMLFMLRRYFQ